MGVMGDWGNQGEKSWGDRTPPAPKPKSYQNKVRDFLGTQLPNSRLNVYQNLKNLVANATLGDSISPDEIELLQAAETLNLVAFEGTGLEVIFKSPLAITNKPAQERIIAKLPELLTKYLDNYHGAGTIQTEDTSRRKALVDNIIAAHAKEFGQGTMLSA
jgi:hypothetical protein